MQEQPTKRKELGAFYTPSEIADFLVSWSVRKPSDIVLDPAAGEGVFVDSSLRRLETLGADPQKASKQVLAIEYDFETYSRLVRRVGSDKATLVNKNFLELAPTFGEYDCRTTLPTVDAIVGNPPYVERQLLGDVQKIRKRLSEVFGVRIGRLTDIYGYFLLHAIRFLRPGGRLAFIISDTWMAMDFGVKIKELLLNAYRIHAIIGFNRRVFSDALVRTVLLLVEKAPESLGPQEGPVQFMRLRDTIPSLDLLERIEKPSIINGRVERLQSIPQYKLTATEPWSVYIKGSSLFFRIKSHRLCVPLTKIAVTGIGLFSLANNFYILRQDMVKKLGIEPNHLIRIAVSPKNTPLIIDKPDDVEYYAIYCNKPKKEIAGTGLLRYVTAGERKRVRIRTKNKHVVGYQNLPRIIQAKRNPWYNIKTEIDKRCRRPILIPRRSFTHFRVYYNKARIAFSDNFVGAEIGRKDLEIPLLAILNSSVTEYMARMQANIYGGGVYDLRPDDVKAICVPDVTRLENVTLAKLRQGYSEFASSWETRAIDESLYRLLDLNGEEQKALQDELSELRQLSFDAKG